MEVYCGWKLKPISPLPAALKSRGLGAGALAPISPTKVASISHMWSAVSGGRPHVRNDPSRYVLRSLEVDVECQLLRKTHTMRAPPKTIVGSTRPVRQQLFQRCTSAAFACPETLWKLRSATEWRKEASCRATCT
jgi:hypothetical protein